MGFLNKLGAFKPLIQCFIGCVISATLIGLSHSKIVINIGGAFGLSDGKTRTSFGVAEQLSEGTKCDMRVVNPFEIIPETLPENYLCSWDQANGNGRDALCFDPFECVSLHQLWTLYLATGCVYLISYVWYGLVWTMVRNRWITNIPQAKMLHGGIIVLMVCNFIFNKVLDKYLMGVFMEDFSEKIRSIIANNGYPGFQFKGDPVYDIQGTKRISQSLFDICSGMIVGMVIEAIDNIRNMSKRSRERRIHNIELMERLQ